jgi:hypothetical protein
MILNKFGVVILIYTSVVLATTDDGARKGIITHMLCEHYCNSEDVIVLGSGSAYPQSYFIEGKRRITRSVHDSLRRGLIEYPFSRGRDNAMPKLARSVREIQKKYLDSDHKLSGIILVKFTINRDGSVVNDSILFSTTENQQFDKDIRDAIRKSKWDENENGTTTITFPLTFWKTKDDYDADERGIGGPGPFYGPFDKKKRIELAILWNGHPSFGHIWIPGAGSVTLDSVIEVGSYDTEIHIGNGTKFMRFLGKKVPSLRQTYNQQLKQKPKLGGKITIKFTGKDKTVNIVSSTTGNAEFDNAVKNELAAWTTWPYYGVYSKYTLTATLNFSNKEKQK